MEAEEAEEEEEEEEKKKIRLAAKRYTSTNTRTSNDTLLYMGSRKRSGAFWRPRISRCRQTRRRRCCFTLARRRFASDRPDLSRFYNEQIEPHKEEASITERERERERER